MSANERSQAALSKPLIGITGRQFPYGDVAGSPALLARSRVDAVLTDYVTAVLLSGGLPVHIPFDVDPGEIVERLDGVLLTGGADVEPARYDAEVDPATGAPQPERDRFELAVAAAAIEQRSPTLGVCRGLQVLSIAAGGTLKQHVRGHARVDETPKNPIHDLTVEPESVLHEIYGPRHRVNSLHHQVIDRPGEGFIVSARSEDGEIEAMEFLGAPIIGVQWHPEMLQRREPIFEWLVGAASKTAD